MNIEEATINVAVFRIIGFEGFKDSLPWPHSIEGMGRRKYCLEQWFSILQNKGLGIIIQLKERRN